MTITLGHSPDPDDAFMFYALAKHLIPTGEYEFEHVLRDIQTLNECAKSGELDVTAISIHAYPYVADQYALLPSGASMGDGYGPMLVARHPLTRDEIARATIAIPGKMTSAFLALQLWLKVSSQKLNCKVVPFDRIFEAVRSGEAEAGLVIHEGQLTYAAEGLTVCQDLGKWWSESNGGLPLPLGANVIHKRFAQGQRSAIAELVGASIRYSLEHRDPAVDYALQFGRGLNRALADQFVGMYVNHWTLDYGERGREAIRRFLGQGHAAGLAPGGVALEFVEPCSQS